jgi:3-phosphoshikimate 1-carboxyvinyltransferase
MAVSISRATRLRGRVSVPGDKSISHRALMLGALADGETAVSNLSTGEDVASTAACLHKLGVRFTEGAVRGVGLHGLQRSEAPLDCGNSGTTMRLLAGLLVGQPFESVLVGDASLSRRPMDRVVAPLREMGAAAETGPPLRVGGRTPLQAIEYRTPVPSAQVKSAVLLAGLFAEGETVVEEAVRTRDHTERMLRAMGADVEISATHVRLRPPESLRARRFITVPGDLSAAAFWLVAATVHPDARVELPRVGVNPTRTALLQLMTAAGACIERSDIPDPLEPIADLVVSSAREVRPLTIGGELAAELIDELPVLTVLAATIPGESRITGARELRVKESDRIAAMAAGLKAMGAGVEELEDGWVIQGGRPLAGAHVDSYGDHRVAMALAVAGLVADGTTEVAGAECVAISYPGFWKDLEALCLG